MAFGSLGGAVASNILLFEQAPRYELGYGLSFGVLVAGMIATVILRFAYKSANKNRAALPEEEVRTEYSEGKTSLASYPGALETVNLAPVDQLLELDDKSTMYRYAV